MNLNLLNCCCLLILSMMITGCDTEVTAGTPPSSCTNKMEEMNVALEACQNSDGSSGLANYCETGTLEQCQTMINTYYAWYSDLTCNSVGGGSFNVEQMLAECETVHSPS